VPSDVVLVAHGSDGADGCTDFDAAWVETPWLGGTGPAGALFIDNTVDSASESWASLQGRSTSDTTIT
jgi:hypothetical protein